MGCAITEILEAKEVGLKDLSGKVLAVDAMNQLYMFLSSIRGADGSYLTDSKGNVTSHLSGLYFRFLKLMQEGLSFIFVFDGLMPELKQKERERRSKLKEQAQQEYDKARAEQDTEAMKKYASRTSKITREMKDEAQKLIRAMGIPVVHAAEEGEAQAAELVRKGEAYAVMSQDADALLFGSQRVVKNLSITRRRKQAGKLAYGTVNPELINLKENLRKLQLSQDELIMLGILTGTDFNIGGIRGIGPKKALKLVKEHGKAAFDKAGWSKHFDVGWEDVFRVFKEPAITQDYEIEWTKPDEEEIVHILVEEHEFGKERVLDGLNKLNRRKQKGLSEFF